MSIAFIIAALISFSLTPLVIFWYRKFGWIDKPDAAKPMTTHKRPVPRGGGIPIAISVISSMLFFVALDQRLAGIILGLIILTVIGVADDRYNLNPYLRLFFLFMAAGAVVMSGIGIPFINVPFLGVVRLDQPQLTFPLLGEVRSVWILADLFALVWIVGLMNFVNWSKGLDGQLPGIVVIASLVIGALSLRFSADITQWSVIILAIITAGAYAGFLPWNFYPQKIMPGFGGGVIGGYLLAIMSLLSTTKVGTLLVVLGIPLTDAVIPIIRRLAQKRSPVWGDRGHLHHRLLDDLGWSKRKIALFYWGITAILGIIALRLNSQQKFYTMLSIGLILISGFIWLTHFGRSSKQHDRKDG